MAVFSMRAPSSTPTMGSGVVLTSSSSCRYQWSRGGACRDASGGPCGIDPRTAPRCSEGSCRYGVPYLSQSGRRLRLRPGRKPPLSPEWYSCCVFSLRLVCFSVLKLVPLAPPLHRASRVDGLQVPTHRQSQSRCGPLPTCGPPDGVLRPSMPLLRPALPPPPRAAHVAWI